jgi:hypothetical protein
LRHIYKLLEAEKFKKFMQMKTIKIQTHYFPLNYSLPFRYCFTYFPLIWSNFTIIFPGTRKRSDKNWFSLRLIKLSCYELYEGWM